MSFDNSNHGHAPFTEHKMSIDELANRLATDVASGLHWEEAKKRLLIDGPNILKPPKKHYEIVRFIKSLFNGFSSLLWFGAVLSLFVFFFDGWQKEEKDYDNLGLALALIFVVFIAGLFSFYQEGKSDRVMQSFLTMLPDEAQVIRSGKVSRILATKLVTGDLVLIEAGDKIAADVRIIDANSLRTDHSCLTGESSHLTRSSRPTHHDPLRTENLAFFGTFAVEGSGKAIVIRTGEKTLMGSIARLTSDIKDPPTTLAKEISHFIFYLVVWACCTGFIISVAMLIIGHRWHDALTFFVGMIIANVPEGLAPTLTLSLTLASQRMASRNCLVKKLEVVESLGSTSVVCTDKTGTLTQNRMTVSHLMFNRRLIGVRLLENKNNRKTSQTKEFIALSRCATLCSRAKFKSPGRRTLSITGRDVIGDASEAAILKCQEIATESENKRAKRLHPKIFEIPFNSTDKRQLSIHKTPDGNCLLVMKGAPERILSVCSTVLFNEDEVPLNDEWTQKISNACSLLAGSGERVLAFCDYEEFDFNEEHFEPPNEGLRFLGLVSMIDPPRPNVPESVLQCREAGIKVIMVTGDHPHTATAIAKQVHIISNYSSVQEGLTLEDSASEGEKRKANAIVLTGEELENLSNRALDTIVTDYEEIVFARTNPKQKLRIVESCQRTGNVVAVTGDGVNDAPALKKADIGIAMGRVGSGVAKQSAKLILLDDNFATIVNGIEEGRLVFENLKKSIGYTLTHIPPEVLLLLAHLMAGIPLPLSVTAMLCIDVGTDLWPSIALAYEPAEADLLKQKPRKVLQDRLVSLNLVVQVLTMGLLETLSGLLAYFIVMAESGWYPHQLLATISKWSAKEHLLSDSHGVPWNLAERKVLEQMGYSAAFVAIMEMQMINALVFKTCVTSNLTFKFNNIYLTMSAVFSLILTCVFIYIPGISTIFQMQPIPSRWWMPALPLALTMLVYDEIRKKIARENQKGWLFKNTVP